MSESVFEFLSYNVFEVGKMIKSSKKKHVWRLSIDGKAVEVRALESLMSGKFRVMVQDRIIYDHRPHEEVKRFGLDLRFQTHHLFVKKLSDKKYELLFNHHKFVPRSTRKMPKKPSREHVQPEAAEPRQGSTTQLGEAPELMNKEWQEVHEHFLDYNQKDEYSDEELFDPANEQAANRLEPSQFDFFDQSNIEPQEQLSEDVFCFKETPVSPREQPADPRIEIKMRKKEQPARDSLGLDEFLGFDFEAQGQSAGKSSPFSAQTRPAQGSSAAGSAQPGAAAAAQKGKSDDLWDFGAAQQASAARSPLPAGRGPPSAQSSPAPPRERSAAQMEQLFGVGSPQKAADVPIPNIDFNEFFEKGSARKTADAFSLFPAEETQNFPNEFKNALFIEKKRSNDEIFF